MNFERPRWKAVEYSRSQIIKAGKTIKNDATLGPELDNATKVIDNWRAAHAYPLHVFYLHLRRMSSEREDIIVAERLKRLDSVIKKLKRQPTMSLWSMQDLGGCRFIVPSIREVFFFAEKYKRSRIRHKFINEYDYISKPKASGYRSLHLVFEYHSDKNDKYNKNMLIELQFRTHLQHLWATAVETMGLFTKQALKAGEGDSDIKRFFTLVSSLLALEEQKPLVPNTPNNIDEILEEIKELDVKNHFVDMLSAIRVAVESKNGTDLKRQGYYILILNYSKRLLRIKFFMPSQSEEANETYTQIERNRAESQIDAVLVSVSSFQILKAAYPNYFSDIGEFVEILSSYLN